jgi:hypothetical protein
VPDGVAGQGYLGKLGLTAAYGLASESLIGEHAMRIWTSKALIGILLVPFTAFLLGSACAPTTPPADGGGGGGTQPTTLLTTTKNNLNPVTFNPGSAGKVITASVTGDVSGSRVRVVVRDNLNAIVAEEQNPVTNNTTVSFTSTTTGQHVMQMTQVGTAAPTYTILVTEAP